MFPVDLLRNALERLASTSEAYMYLKERFIRNYAVVCTAGYILGIGDRHLENFLVNY
jgi:DNA-dependent protein kinase catalytic subunit